ncbi:MAG: glycoside hydrolase family 43 protein [Clostridiales bacterium]
MKKIMNPILRGFNPDPSIVRVGSDYYLAVSTFEWFPGVFIYHSKDLVNWEFVSAPLDSLEKVDLRGLDSSCGIWAPNLTYSNGNFYLLYTIVHTATGRYKDTHNFMISSDKIDRNWTNPIFLNCSGFDPSLFHDDDRKWVVNMTIDHRITKTRFSGIVIQEFDEKNGKLIGSIYNIFKGTELGVTEGPNIMKRNGYYYLTVAEGGTSYGHCVTCARSKSIIGKYEVAPNNPIIKSNPDTDYPIKRAGHGQLVDTPNGDWYMSHLCARSVKHYSILGRETAIQNIIWDDDGWYRLEKGGNLALDYYEVSENIKYNYVKKSIKEDFNDAKLPWYFMTLRESFEDCQISLTKRKGWLSIKGGNSLSSKYKQALLAKRQEALEYQCSVKMEFKPLSHHHMAGITCYYNNNNYHYLRISRDEKLDICINVTTSENMELEESNYISIGNTELVYLRAIVNVEKLDFYYSLDNNEYIKIGKTLDMKIISDEHVNGNGFTGAMIGMTCQDLRGDGVYASFDWFEYKEL